MPLNYAIIENGEITNIAVAESPLAENWLLLPDGFGIGDLYIGGEFSKKPEPVIDKATTERAWKNSELARTQDIMAVPDYRYHTEMAAYRQQLMDWTDSDDFPDVRPVIPLTKNGFPIY